MVASLQFHPKFGALMKTLSESPPKRPIPPKIGSDLPAHARTASHGSNPIKQGNPPPRAEEIDGVKKKLDKAKTSVYF
jgi:hypothetical protein